MATFFKFIKPLILYISKPPPTATFHLHPLRSISITRYAPHTIQDQISSLKKRTSFRKKRTTLVDDNEIIQQEPGVFNVVAFATAEEYNLEGLIEGLKKQELYQPDRIENNSDVVRAVAKYQVDREPREIFFFREGSVIFWNVSDLESSNVLGFLKNYEQDGYSEGLIYGECEFMNYRYQEEGKPSSLNKSGDFLLSTSESNILDKYTFSNALSLSVKLGIWEALLEKYIDSIELLTEDLKSGNKIRISRDDCMRKHGELYALRHSINLSSDLLDVPDFYWEQEELEKLYLQTCAHFSINKRTKVMNEKLNHCIELVELISSHLTERHHTRLEWMIIILIMVEVAFETLHYIDRFYIEEINK